MINWILTIIVVAAVFALVITCVVKRSTEYRDGSAKQQANTEEKQFQVTLDLIKEFPTAAGKKEKGK
jgi:hypothetical protein